MVREKKCLKREGDLYRCMMDGDIYTENMVINICDNKKDCGECEDE